jgi:hypothetical protein
MLEYFFFPYQGFSDLKALHSCSPHHKQRFWLSSDFLPSFDQTEVGRVFAEVVVFFSRFGVLETAGRLQQQQEV